MRRRIVLLAALGLSGCWGDDVGLGSLAMDAGLPVEVTPADAGQIEVPDARPDAAIDAGVAVDAGFALDAGSPDAAVTPDASVPPDAGSVDAGPPPPSRVLFIGNSFTLQGPVPDIVQSMARYAGFDGFAALDVDYRAVGGRTLEWHRADNRPEGAPARLQEGWDAVVLQEFSTRPTDAVGPAERFKQDATWFHDLARAVNPTCRVVLYQTWARRFDHGIYPDTFPDPAQMQGELLYHYDDAALRYIPRNSNAASGADVRVAHVGEAWAAQLSGGEPPRLHSSDRYHAGDEGQYLSALVLYGTLFGRRAHGMVPLNGVAEGVAEQLQDTADSILVGVSGYGARPGPALPMPLADPVKIDLGPDVDASMGFTPIVRRRGTVVNLMTESGAQTSAYVTAFGFFGTQTGGQEANTLGLSPFVSRDTLWVGTFDGHAAASNLEARLVVRGLPPGGYRVTLFASRNGNDEGNGRLTRYRIGTEHRDLDAVDNTSRTAVFEDVALDARGEIVIRVGVSPDGTSRFAYAGALWVERTSR